MPTYGAKDIVVKPIPRKQADAIIKQYHYSGKVVNNSQLHIGVFLNGVLHGAMQFGPPLDKSKVIGLVSGTGWNELLELNRMAFGPALPRNSESRALAITFRMMRKLAPSIKWILSFADGTLCGDGTIYRAAGFLLTGIKKNNQIWQLPNGEPVIKSSMESHANQRNSLISRTSMTAQGGKGADKQKREIINRVTSTKGNAIAETGGASMKPFIEAGARPLPGFQLRYIYFLDQSYRERLTVPVLPFSAIAEHGATMYKGQTRAGSSDSGTGSDQLQGDGASPIPALRSDEDN
jgi:hypothetical protein